MAVPALLASAATSALGKIPSLLNPGKARDQARIQRRDFFLNAAKGGSVTGACYLLGGQKNVASNEKTMYNDGIKELENGPAEYQETLATARQLGPLWGGSDDPFQDVVNAKSPIERELNNLVNAVRNDVSQTIANVSAGAGSAAASAVAGTGSAKSTVLVPTTSSTLVIVGLVALALLYFAMRKR